MVCSFDGKTRYRLGPVTAGHLVRAASLSTDSSGHSTIDLTLDPDGRAALTRLTTAAFRLIPPGSVALMLDGRVLLASRANGAITTGHVELAGLTAAQARQVVEGRLPA